MGKKSVCYLTITRLRQSSSESNTVLWRWRTAHYFSFESGSSMTWSFWCSTWKRLVLLFWLNWKIVFCIILSQALAPVVSAGTLIPRPEEEPSSLFLRYFHTELCALKHRKTNTLAVAWVFPHFLDSLSKNKRQKCPLPCAYSYWT